MEHGNINKIIIVSLCDSFTKELGKILSQNLDMIFCDTKDLIEYELIDKNAIEQFCTTEYLEQSEKRVVKHIASFMNVVVSINYDYLVHNLEILKNNSLFVFLNLPKKYIEENGNAVNVISYENRSQTLTDICDVVVSIRKTDLDFVCEKLIKILGGVL